MNDGKDTALQELEEEASCARPWGQGPVWCAPRTGRRPVSMRVTWWAEPQEEVLEPSAGWSPSRTERQGSGTGNHGGVLSRKGHGLVSPPKHHSKETGLEGARMKASSQPYTMEGPAVGQGREGGAWDLG